MVNTFIQAVKFLENYVPIPAKKHPGELGLKRMDFLCSELGNPQLKYPTIHVGGTSGKGSTSTIIASILATKYKVGLHTSPHLVKITERIVLGTPISDQDFINLINIVKPIIYKMEKSELGAPSYFEIVTAMAFLAFAYEKVDIAVIEVGMGGRFDATNVIKPFVAVLTNVGLDHTEILGDTVEKIAEDKVGIIKPGIEVVSGVKQSSVIEIIKSKCKIQNAKLSLLGKDFHYKINKLDEKGSVFDYFGKQGSDLERVKGLTLSLLGEFQVENASLAVRAVEVLLNQQLKTNFSIFHYPFSITQIKIGLSKADIYGRFEIIKKQPLIILDGAHNPDKVRALSASIRTIFPKKHIIAVIAIKDDKKAKEMISELLSISDQVIFTNFRVTADLGVISSYNPTELKLWATTIDKNKKMMIKSNAREAIDSAIKLAKEEDLILATGSLYLIGQIKKIIGN